MDSRSPDPYRSIQRRVCWWEPRRPLAAMILLMFGALVSACNGDDDDASSRLLPETTAAAPRNTPERYPPGGDTPAGPASRRTTGCTPGSQAPPNDYIPFVDEDPTDFDGDGKVDGLYFKRGSPSDLFVASTAGKGAHAHVQTPKPYHRMGGIDPDGDGDHEMFVRLAAPDGAMVQVLTFTDCRVSFALDVQGQPYRFRVAREERTGNGVGCIDATGDGRQDLVRLHYERHSTTVHWTRTVVRLEGGRAVDGPTDGGRFTSPRDDARIAALSEATCGEKTTFLG